ncbi:hypothetical protein A3H38_01235 [candidate division WOR-1 bacterium RIFCSPLOWO2_02_FULL_46_20]|uniref:Coenzyme A biosynthesis bifunctional protein CoaBC n=1 Tax=candidate division WOR-1 bacterium RIFCSPLOWO2_02_FULL_46_20 TaxID=1802567 RepID=A0A1F4RCT1_UNCSA|nr:MAG: hypothetical protein A3J44_02480 [candidate division WOR-1 bacterium RIFCSPHIGHO2_02_FULL_45_12]OGC06004.1 MAG: hypothetical protein A3H38_01235 [candidate division WOR-1 bacterium RIFCSPLOWO2_02_FULL_46_20]
MLKDKTIIVGVSGSIAAYKACEVVSRLKNLGAEVWVVMTDEATKLIAPLTFRALSGNPVITDLFAEELTKLPMPHVFLTKKASLMVITPGTANIIGKIAGGIADDPLTTMILASTAKKLIAPAMNCEMWRNPIIVENVEKLKGLKFEFSGPEKGKLACGDEDIGRMSEPEEIVEKVVELIGIRQDLKGKRILVTAGGTKEAIDPVRYISNRSSGKMGYAIAQAARERGASVTLISANGHCPAPHNVKRVKVESAQEMLEAVLRHYSEADAVVMAAAVGDYTPKLKTQNSKLKTKELTIQFGQTEDILKIIGKQKGRSQKVLIGFALETENMIANAKKKLVEKKLDLIVANDDSTFNSDSIKFSTIDRKGEVKDYPQQAKAQAAQVILDNIACMLR